MSKRTRRARRKLKAHDRGVSDRHNHGYAAEQKAARRAHETQAQRSFQPPKKAGDD